MGRAIDAAKAILELSRVFHRYCGHRFNDDVQCVGCTRRAPCQEWDEKWEALAQADKLAKQLSDLRAASPFIDGVDIMRDRAQRAEEWSEKARAYIREGKTGLSHPNEYRALLGPRGQ
jgi:hypothetical protein